MKAVKIMSICLVLLIFTSMFCFPTTLAASIGVGTILNPSEIPEWVTDVSNLRKIVVKEYINGTKLKCTTDNGVSYFDYGQTTDDFLFMGRTSIIDNVPSQKYMIQIFKGGNSSRMGTSAIVVTEESYKKGEAYTIRDFSAQSVLPNAGSVAYGVPLKNQFWIGDCVYQPFTFGCFVEDYSNQSTPGDAYYYSYHDGYEAPTGGTEERYEYKYKGDMDGDEKITVTDVVELRRIILKAGTIAEPVKVKGDTDGDFGITVSDVVELRRMIMKGA